MDIPMHTWGKHYFVPKIQNRDHSGLLRIFAKEDNTTIYRDGLSFASLPQGKGGLLNEGWLENRVWPRLVNNDTPKIALYSADKPISITYFNPSAQDDENNSNSDPFAMAITPVEQFQTEIVFATPAAKGGDQNLNGYKENYLMMVYETEDPSGAPPPDLEWGVVGKDETVWKKVSTVFSGQPFKYHTLDGAGGSDDIDWDTPYDGKIYGHLNIQLPGQGVFGVRSVDRQHNFAVYAYGYDSWDSYGWPTSTALTDIFVEDQVAPNITKASNCSNTEWNGTASEEPANLENRSGFYSISLDYKSSENFSLIPVNTIQAPGDAPQVIPWKLKVENPLLPGYAVLVFLDRAGNFTLDTTEYFPRDINLFEKNAGYDENWDFTEDWGLRNLGQENAESNTFIIENISESNTFTITEVLLQKKDEGFTITKINGIDYANFSSTFNLLPQTSLEIEVEFWTDKWGAFLDTITVYDCDSNKYAEIQLTAKVGNAVMSVNDLTFDSYDIDLKNEENNETVFKSFAVENIVCEADSLTYEPYLPLVLTGFSSTLGEEFDLSGIESAFEQGGGKIEIAPAGVQIFSLGFKASELKSYSGKILFEYEDGAKICSNESNVSVQTISTSIQDWPSDWTLSPNPASENLSVKNIENGRYELFIYDLKSNLVMNNSVSISSGDLLLNVGDLSPAVYFLELKKDRFSYRTQFVKK
jgi:IgGFc binding protein/Secretion system C-terminal sorting domain